MKKQLLSTLMALALCLTLLPTAALADDGQYTVVYTDGVENAEIFSDRTHSYLSLGAQTPEFRGNLERA